MKLNPLKNLLSRDEIISMIIWLVVGGMVQILAKKIIENNPEFMESNPKKEEGQPRFISPRGGDITEVTNIKDIIRFLFKFAAKKGLVTATVAWSGRKIVDKIPLDAISTYVLEGLPQSFLDLEKKKYTTLPRGKKISLEECDDNINYLFTILEEEKISLAKKEELAKSTLTKYLNLETNLGRIKFILCIISLLYTLYYNDMSNFNLTMENLVRAIKEGKVSKSMARVIVRNLKKKGVLIHPELAEIIKKPQ